MLTCVDVALDFDINAGEIVKDMGKLMQIC